MARLVAFGLFAWAAFDWPAWILDRSGLALAAAAFLSLAVGRKKRPPLYPTGIAGVSSLADEAAAGGVADVDYLRAIISQAQGDATTVLGEAGDRQ